MTDTPSLQNSSNENIIKWCKINGELSEAREHAEKVIVQYARDETTATLAYGYKDIVRAIGELTPEKEYDVRLALTRVVGRIAGDFHSLQHILESHGGNTSKDAAINKVKKGVDEALSNEICDLLELWKTVNT